MASDEMNEELGWDEEITTTDDSFVLLDPGEYGFVVSAFDRERFDGSAKMSACNMAVLSLTVAQAGGPSAEVQTRLYLNRKQEWRLTQFFKSISLIKPDSKGDNVKLPWGKVVGSTGRVKIKHRTYNGREYNDVVEFVVPSVTKSYGGDEF